MKDQNNICFADDLMLISYCHCIVAAHCSLYNMFVNVKSFQTLVEDVVANAK